MFEGLKERIENYEPFKVQSKTISEMKEKLEKFGKSGEGAIEKSIGPLNKFFDYLTDDRHKLTQRFGSGLDPKEKQRLERFMRSDIAKAEQSLGRQKNNFLKNQLINRYTVGGDKTKTTLREEGTKPMSQGSGGPNSRVAKDARELYEIGILAEAQWHEAVMKGEKNKSWTPTNRWTLGNVAWVANDFKAPAAVESIAAMGIWVNSFLRKESGAAIPKDERASYFHIYFPQPGDTPKAVNDKRKQRYVKMNAARRNAGLDGGGVGEKNKNGDGADIY